MLFAQAAHPYLMLFAQAAHPYLMLFAQAAHRRSPPFVTIGSAA
jgi:hypothetical protein